MASTTTQTLSSLFPAATEPANAQDPHRRPLSLRVDLQHVELVHQLLATADGIESLAAAVQTTFALLLRAYTGLDRVCFGIQKIGGRSVHDDRTAISPAMVLDIDEETSLEQLDRDIRSTPIIDASNNEGLKYNTAILFRFSNTTVTQSSTFTTMSDSVRTPLISCTSRVT
ncbi:hypothetical protein CC80DRAFT_203009 [Byssothecium circinans]|uniref:Condensation domain-containing protein n=1 Tax=Byssothecium circinans TaxID=147558 RepID=A0A6A5TIG0_9PLEO|nr:hypothetical protein CC80DRAFT_203009 [Byssothecium circinans]